MKGMKRLLHEIAAGVQEEVDRTRGRDWSKIVGNSADGGLTRLIDWLAEDVILKMVKERGEKLNILTEELGWIDNKASLTLIIDPIDGSVNAVNRLPLYSVSLAIGKERLGDVQCGLVRNLVSNDVYWAERGKGAFLNGRRIHVRGDRFEPEGSVVSIYVGQTASAKALKLAKRFKKVRALGSASLEMCLVAGGNLAAYYLNVFPKEKGVRVTDIAASALILTEAGGEVYDDEFQPLDVPLNLDERMNLIAVPNKRMLEMMR